MDEKENPVKVTNDTDKTASTNPERGEEMKSNPTTTGAGETSQVDESGDPGNEQTDSH